MILTSKNKEDFFMNLDSIGLKEKIEHDKSVIIKINLARPATAGHPRTDIKLLSDIIEYIYLNNGTCAIAEAANGYLKQNLESAGLKEVIEKYKVYVIDLDFEEVDEVFVNGEEHFIPRCLKNYGVRIGIPVTSKRPQMVFSNNVKLFVGAVPRMMYQINNTFVDWRPRIHIDLHNSVANLFNAIQDYSPFDFYINGGKAMEENRGEFMFEETLIGDNAVELDIFILNSIFPTVEVPEYLEILKKNRDK